MTGNYAATKKHPPLYNIVDEYAHLIDGIIEFFVSFLSLQSGLLYLCLHFLADITLSLTCEMNEQNHV